ncbi:MAG TPA: SH3 domain-containing protein [Nocardioidaceae bacterium]|nr:SH3 domain-containing protein [Nocardioidaceae bacterium]
MTSAAVAGGVFVSLPEEAPAQSVSAISMARPEVRSVPVPVRVAPISRSEDRVRLEPKPPEVTGHLFSTTVVNIRALPSEDARRVGSLEWAEKIPVSGVTRGEWTEVVLDGQSAWVFTAYLDEKKPRPEPEPKETAEPEPEPEPEPVATGLSMAPCATGSDVESGIVPNAVAVHRAVCAAFPQVTSYGGWREDSGEHGTGQALDIMISGDTGWEIAEFVRANAGDLGVSEVLYSQKIWTVERGSEGWRWMEDRGSTTANHYDHVHVTVY